MPLASSHVFQNTHIRKYMAVVSIHKRPIYATGIVAVKSNHLVNIYL